MPPETTRDCCNDGPLHLINGYGLTNFFDRVFSSWRICKFFRKTGSMSANQAISSRFLVGPSRHVSQYVFIKPFPCHTWNEKKKNKNNNDIVEKRKTMIESVGELNTNIGFQIEMNTSDRDRNKDGDKQKQDYVVDGKDWI